VKGVGTALKPAWEPIVFSIKPREGTYVDNIAKWGVGGINIDTCRLPYNGDKHQPCTRRKAVFNFNGNGAMLPKGDKYIPCDKGRIPSNMVWTYPIDPQYDKFFMIPKEVKRNDIDKHPTKKPVELFIRLVEQYTYEGATVLDPFAGSGTTGRACRLTERNCIMFEIEKRYEPALRERAMLNQPAIEKFC